MADQALKSLVTRASHASAGVPPSIAQVRAGRTRRRSYFPTGVLAASVSGAAAIFILANLPGREAQLPAAQLDPEFYLVSDELERSDWLVQTISSEADMISRSDWLLVGASPSRQVFASDYFSPSTAHISEAYLLVDQSGKPVTDPDQPNVIYVIERTTP